MIISERGALRTAQVADLGRRAVVFLRTGRSRGLIAAGVMDAGFGSLAGLLAGLYAAHFLEPALLGAYAIYFAAFVFSGFVPAMLYLLPSRVAALETEQPKRIAILPRTLLAGAMLSGLAALLTPFAGVFVLGDVSVSALAPLAITAAALVFTSPLQDHLRATLHLAGRPTRAVHVSLCQLAVVALVMVVLHSTSIQQQWVPFGALAIANLTSMAFGLWLARHDLFAHAVGLPSIGAVVKQGWAQLLVSTLPYAAHFLVAGFVAAFVSADSLGYAEAARIVAQPIQVAGLGVAQALTPQLMQAGQSRSRSLATRIRLLYLVALSLCLSVYASLVGWPHNLNPMSTLLPGAYHFSALVICSLAAMFVVNLGLVGRLELTGSGRSNDLIYPAVAGSVAHLCFAAATMWFLGAYTIPLGLLVSVLVTGALTFRKAQALYPSRAR